MHSFSDKISKLNSKSIKSRRKKKNRSKHDNFVTKFDVDNKTNNDFSFTPTNVFELLFHPIKVNSSNISKNNFCDYVSSLLVSPSEPINIRFNDLCTLGQLFDSNPVRDAIDNYQYCDQKLDWYDWTNINSIHINRSYDFVGYLVVCGTDGQDGFYDCASEIEQHE